MRRVRDRPRSAAGVKVVVRRVASALASSCVDQRGIDASVHLVEISLFQRLVKLQKLSTKAHQELCRDVRAVLP